MRKFKALLLLLLALPLLSGAAADDLRAIEKAWVEVVEKLEPSVVAITVIPRDSRERGRRFPICSGVIFDNSGYVVTLTRDFSEQSHMAIKLSNGRMRMATLAGRDKKTGITVLKIRGARDLVPADFGNSDEMRPGSFIVTISNTYGMPGTVNYGHISGVDRKLEGEDGVEYSGMMQISLTVRDGDPGGLVAGTDGKVVGLISPCKIGNYLDSPDKKSSEKRSPSERKRGKRNPGSDSEKDKKPVMVDHVGFAMPANYVMFIARELRDNGKAVRGSMGVMVLDQTTLGQSKKGLRIVTVKPDSGAEKAGILLGDVIVSFDGKKISSLKDLQKISPYMLAGKTYEVEVMRGDKLHTFKITLDERDKPAPVRPQPRPRKNKK